MTVFQSANSVLLTGAGFSKDFGGYLGTEMWSVIFSQPEIQQHPKLRRYLLENLNYELAYSKAMRPDAFDADIQKKFTEAVGRSYQQMHEAFYEPGVRIPARGLCTSIVGRFVGTGERERGFVFTLNQDLFLERFYCNGTDALFDLSIPEINNFGCFNYKLPKENTHEYNFELPGEEKVKKLESTFWKNKAYGRFSYLKLHGSYWWKSADGSDAMVIGSEKTGLIEREPYLKWSHSVFDQVLSSGGIKLVVIGYSFGDLHINSIISRAIKEHGLKLYIVSLEKPEDFREKMLHSTEKWQLWENLHGYYCCTVTALYIGHNGDLTSRGKSLIENLGL